MKVSKKSPFLGISYAQFLRVSGRLTALAWLGGLPPPRPIFFAPMDVVVEAEGGKGKSLKGGKKRKKEEEGLWSLGNRKIPRPCFFLHASPPPSSLSTAAHIFPARRLCSKVSALAMGGGRRKGERVFVPLFSFGEKYVRKCLTFQKIMPFLLKMWALLTSVQLENANSFLFFFFLFLCPSLGHSCSEVSWGRRAGLLRFRVPVCIGGRRV